MNVIVEASQIKWIFLLTTERLRALTLSWDNQLNIYSFEVRFDLRCLLRRDEGLSGYKPHSFEIKLSLDKADFGKFKIFLSTFLLVYCVYAWEFSG